MRQPCMLFTLSMMVSSSSSGVIIDCCHKHGARLDGGELKRLMEWKKTGGLLQHEKMAQERNSAKAKRQRHEAMTAGADTVKKERIWDASDDDLLSSVFKLVD